MIRACIPNKLQSLCLIYYALSNDVEVILLGICSDALFKNVKYIGNHVKLIIAVYNNHIITSHYLYVQNKYQYSRTQTTKPQSNKVISLYCTYI